MAKTTPAAHTLEIIDFGAAAVCGICAAELWFADEPAGRLHRSRPSPSTCRQ